MGVRWSRMSWAEKNELWQRWRRGETLRQIAGALHRRSSSIYEYVGAEGGITPRRRQRSRLALTTTEREEILRQLARGDSIRAIGRVLGRAPSTRCDRSTLPFKRGVRGRTATSLSMIRRPMRLGSPQTCRPTTRGLEPAKRAIHRLQA
jgi:DNA-binding CsgD family transcriptional regulator